MNRRSSAVTLNPWLAGATCCCAWSVGWNTGRPIGDSIIAIIVSTAQRFAARERRHVKNFCFTLMISSTWSRLPQRHTPSYSDRWCSSDSFRHVVNEFVLMTGNSRTPRARAHLHRRGSSNEPLVATDSSGLPRRRVRRACATVEPRHCCPRERGSCRSLTCCQEGLHGWRAERTTGGTS